MAALQKKKELAITANSSEFLVGRAGFEPATNGLKVRGENHINQHLKRFFAPQNTCFRLPSLTGEDMVSEEFAEQERIDFSHLRPAPETTSSGKRWQPPA
jgi:hypothetical protein